jgi:hypothetical protein
MEKYCQGGISSPLCGLPEWAGALIGGIMVLILVGAFVVGAVAIFTALFSPRIR